MEPDIASLIQGRFKHRACPDCKGERVNALFKLAHLRQTSVATEAARPAPRQ